MNDCYFAYGSNLDAPRLEERVPGARALGYARLVDFSLRCDKYGRDGSGKANVTPELGSEVWGALYAFDRGRWPELDRHERGYRRVTLRVRCDGGRARWAQTYRAVHLTDDPRPYAWYRDLMVRGARAHHLPEAYVAGLAALETAPDRAAPETDRR